LSALFFAPAAAPSANALGPGSLDQPVGSLPQTGHVYNRTHWSVQLGDTITGQIVGATDANLQGATEADVVIKSSHNGNTTITGTMSGTTITFSWIVPANGCDTAIAPSGPVGAHPTSHTPPTTPPPPPHPHPPPSTPP